MGLRFRKSIKVAPGIRMSVSKSGVGMSVGGKGLRYSVHSSGRRQTTASIPGSGISYTTVHSNGKSYKSSAYQQRQALVQKQREQQKLEERMQNQLEVEMFENKLDMIRAMHTESDEYVDWSSLLHSVPPFEKGSMGPKEQAAKEEVTSYKPGLFAKLFKQDIKQLSVLEQNVLQAKQEDEADFAAWEHVVQTAKRITEGDIDAYFEVIEEFRPLDDLLEFGSGFEFFANHARCLEVEFDVKSEDVVPIEVISLTKTGKVSRKAMPKGRYYDIQQDYVCSCIIRIARDLFALLPLTHVYIHALDERVNSSTGHKEKVVILSVCIDRDTLETLNLDHIDCSDAITANFPYKMNWKKTKGFEPVERLTEEVN